MQQCSRVRTQEHSHPGGTQIVTTHPGSLLIPAHSRGGMEERCPNPGDVGAQTLPAPQLSASTIVLFPCLGIIPLRSRGIEASQPTSLGQQDSIITVGTKGPVSSSPHHCPPQHGHSLSVDPAAPQPYWHPMGGGKELSSVPPSLPVSPQQGSPPPLHPNNPLPPGSPAPQPHQWPSVIPVPPPHPPAPPPSLIIVPC